MTGFSLMCQRPRVSETFPLERQISIYLLLVGYQWQGKEQFYQSPTWQPMSLLGLCIEHGLGVTYRSVSDPKAVAPSSLPSINRGGGELLTLAFHGPYIPAPQETIRPCPNSQNHIQPSRRRGVAGTQVRVLRPPLISLFFHVGYQQSMSLTWVPLVSSRSFSDEGNRRYV